MGEMNYEEAWRQVHNLCAMFEGLTILRKALLHAKEYEKDIMKLQETHATLEKKCLQLDDDMNKRKEQATLQERKIAEDLNLKRLEHENTIGELQGRLAIVEEQLRVKEINLTDLYAKGREETERILKERAEKLRALDEDIAARIRRVIELKDQLTSISMAATKVLGGS